MLLSLFSSLFCQTLFAGLLLRQGDLSQRRYVFQQWFGACRRRIVLHALKGPCKLWQPTSQCYRAENPTNPKIGPKIPARHANSPYGRGSKKYPENTRKMLRKYTNFVYFFSIPGGIWRGISGSLMFCMLGGLLALRWLSYSVAGRGVANVSS